MRLAYAERSRSIGGKHNVCGMGKLYSYISSLSKIVEIILYNLIYNGK